MPVDSGAPAEVDGTQAGGPPPQILVQSIAEDDSNQILQQNSLGTPQACPYAGWFKGNHPISQFRI